MMRELDLDALLREPIVRMLMERDGVRSGDIRQVFQRVQSARALKSRHRMSAVHDVYAQREMAEETAG
jgi:hypothetical protein